MAKRKKSEAPALLPGMRQKSGGSIEYRFMVGDKRYSVNGRDAIECVAKAEKKKQEIEAGSYRKGRELTVSEYCERWLQNRAGTVKETTIRTNRILISRMCCTPIDKAGQKFGELKLKAVEPQNVRDLQRGLLEPITVKEKDRTKEKPALSTRSANDTIHLLKSIYKTAMTERITDWNPAEGVKPMKRTEKPARDTIHRALTREETKKFLDAAEARSSYYLPLYKFLLNTGCRIGEAGALFVGDVKGGAVNVRRTITRNEIGGYEIGEDTKTAAGKRTIPLNEAARSAWNRQREQNALLFGDKVVNMKAPVFVPPCGGLLKSSNVNTDVKKICEAAGIRRFSVHAFRDTFATRCVESGMPIKALQEIMGHTDVSMTLGLYTHVTDDQKAEQLRAVSFE